MAERAREHDKQRIYQISTLQALAMGYTKSVVTVGELLGHGDIGLGTFEGVDGEMILLDGVCYRALEDGRVVVADNEMGVPFSAVTYFLAEPPADYDESAIEPCPVSRETLVAMSSIDELKTELSNKIDFDFSLNSMHVVRIDGHFPKIVARSEAPYHGHHVSLKDILSKNQTEFTFEDIDGTLVAVYFPDYMDGINAPGWHLHFVSEDKTRGGHVFDLTMEKGEAIFNRISQVKIELPTSIAFDTYSLKEASQDEIKEVEQGK